MRRAPVATSLSHQDRRRKPRRQDSRNPASDDRSRDGEPIGEWIEKLADFRHLSESASQKAVDPIRGTDESDEQASLLRGRRVRKATRGTAARDRSDEGNDVRKGEDHWGSRRRKGCGRVRHRRVPRRIHIRRPPETGRCQSAPTSGTTVDAPAGIEAGAPAKVAVRLDAHRGAVLIEQGDAQRQVAIPVGRTHFGDQDHSEAAIHDREASGRDRVEGAAEDVELASRDLGGVGKEGRGEPHRRPPQRWRSSAAFGRKVSAIAGIVVVSRYTEPSSALDSGLPGCGLFDQGCRIQGEALTALGDVERISKRHRVPVDKLGILRDTFTIVSDGTFGSPAESNGSWQTSNDMRPGHRENTSGRKAAAIGIVAEATSSGVRSVVATR